MGGAGIFNPFPRTVLWDYCVERNLIKKPKNIEEWADSYQGFDSPKMNVSGIPDETLMKYYSYMNKLINSGRYFKKTILYLKNKRIPDYRRVISSVKGIIKEHI